MSLHSPVQSQGLSPLLWLVILLALLDFLASSVQSLESCTRLLPHLTSAKHFSSTAVHHSLCTPSTCSHQCGSAPIFASYHQLHLGMRFPCLHLQPQDLGFHLVHLTLRVHLGSKLPCLHRGPSSHHLHWASSSLRLQLGQPSTIHASRLHSLSALHPITLSLWLCQVPPSTPSFSVTRWSRGPEDLLPRLFLGHHPCRHRHRSSHPWILCPGFRHGSSLLWLCRGPLSLLGSGGSIAVSSCSGPPSISTHSWFLAGSFLLFHLFAVSYLLSAQFCTPLSLVTDCHLFAFTCLPH